MASRKEFIDYVCENLEGLGEICSRKMFGDYMIYVNQKPIILVCDDIVYVKEKEEIMDLMEHAQKGIPYEGAKEHYILDMDDTPLMRSVISKLESITPLPKKRKK